MAREFPKMPFERYADDILVHCFTDKQAQYVLEGIRRRLQKCGLRLHPDKTRIVYCKDGLRREEHEHTKFDFPGFEFRPRLVKNHGTGEFFVGFTPAESPTAKKAMRQAIRDCNVKSRTTLSLAEVAARVNPVTRGWITFFGAYRRSALKTILHEVDLALSKWVMRKYTWLHRRRVKSLRWLDGVHRAAPELFPHWQPAPANG